MINVITVVWDFVLEHFWALTTIVSVLAFGRTIHTKYINDPLSGEDGKVQMDELAKGIVMGVLVWAVYRDGYRLHEWPYFSDGFYAALLAGTFAIAAIKPVVSIFNAKFNGNSKSNIQDPPDSDSSTTAGSRNK